MTAQMLLLTLLAIAVFCGLLQRVLDRMYLTDRQALCIVGLMLVGTFIPNISIGPVAVNIGGAVIPFCICVYLLVKANTRQERLRAVIGSLVTAALIFILSASLPAEAEELLFDPLWIYGAVGGIIAAAAGRSRRGAYICATLGILLADILSAVYAAAQGYAVSIVLGGGGIADACVISGVIAVLVCEIVGEIAERFVRMKSRMTEQ